MTLFSLLQRERSEEKQQQKVRLTSATVVLCLAAIFFNTGSFNTMGSTSLFGYGLSGDPNGAYAETTIPVIDRKTQVYQETKNYFMVPDQWD